MNTATSNSSTLSFQNVIFLYRSGMPLPSSIRFACSFRPEVWSDLSFRPTYRTADPVADLRGRSDPHSQAPVHRSFATASPAPSAQPARDPDGPQSTQPAAAADSAADQSAARAANRRRN